MTLHPPGRLLRLLATPVFSLLFLLCAAGDPESVTGPVLEMLPMLPNGSFDSAGDDGGVSRPTHWHVEGAGEWAADPETLLHGTASLRLSGTETVTVLSDKLPLDEDLKTVTAVAMGRGPGLGAALRWLSRDGAVLREDSFRAFPPAEPEGWTRFSLSEKTPPEGARRLVAVLSGTPSGTEPCWWDAAEITGEAHRVPTVQILHNQAGYETFAPKHFLVSANFAASDGRFALLSDDGRTLVEAPLGAGERVIGAENADWGRHYYRGDFSDHDIPGRCRIHVTLGGLEAETELFPLDFDQLWNSLADPAVNGLMSFHAPAGNARLWNDPGKGPVSDAELFLALVEAWDGVRWRVQGGFGGAALDGAVRGLLPAVVARLAAADWNTADAGEMAAWAMAMAFAARCLPAEENVLDMAERLTRHLGDHGTDGARAFSAAAALHETTREAAWLDLTRQWYPGPVAEAQTALMWYGSETDPRIITELGTALEEIGDTLLLRAKNPFGVYSTHGAVENTFFLADADADGVFPGNTHRVLLAAETMARIYRMVAKPEYLAFIHDQLNWVLGCNPLGLCLVEGAGTRPAPLVLMPEGRERDTLAGLVLNGYGPRGPGDDRPWLPAGSEDLPEPALNAFSLRNSARLIGALSHLKRIRTVIPGAAPHVPASAGKP
ncbi:MAG: hypothetical protein GX580_09890 [Candidatus Hydrogenedens sp.]|nr:glycoside hydrolase family 9 protein [Candidatus Hydrogenedentota bacterium]NLF57938.1 hypothetical protein [Candidatus Hydrogenedens sp.]